MPSFAGTGAPLPAGGDSCPAGDVEQIPWDRRIQGDEFIGLILRSYFF